MSGRLIMIYVAIITGGLPRNLKTPPFCPELLNA